MVACLGRRVVVPCSVASARGRRLSFPRNLFHESRSRRGRVLIHSKVCSALSAHVTMLVLMCVLQLNMQDEVVANDFLGPGRRSTRIRFGPRTRTSLRSRRTKVTSWGTRTSVRTTLRLRHGAHSLARDLLPPSNVIYMPLLSGF